VKIICNFATLAKIKNHRRYIRENAVITLTKNRLVDSDLRRADNYSTEFIGYTKVYYAEASANCRRVRFTRLLPSDAAINRQADTHRAHVLRVQL